MYNPRKDVVKRITNECKENGVPVTKDFVSFLLTLFQLNPAYKTIPEEDEKRSKLIEELVRWISDQTRPSLTTLKSQLYFAKHYHERDEIVSCYRLRHRRKTDPLVAEICETEKIASDRDSEKLYQKILVAITLLSGLGSPTVPSVLREVSVALQSVFRLPELVGYVGRSKGEKEEQLMELACIVAGIRLFNRDCRRGGEGIDDLPSILQEATKRTRDAVLDLLERLMSNVYKLTAAVEKTFLERIDREMDLCCDEKETNSSDFATEENAQWAIEMLVASRQQEIYVRKLLNDVKRSEKEVRDLMERLQGRLLKLHDTVRYRTAIPTVQVYPQFIDLADIWMGLQDEAIIIGSVNTFLWELQNINAKTVNVYDRSILEDILSTNEVLTDAERLERSMGKPIDECGDCTLYYPNVTKDFESINLEFLGFCAWSFIRGKGVLIPGNPNNGVARWRGKYYAFVSTEAAKNFGIDPDRYIEEGLLFTRDHPEYVYLFQLYDEIRGRKTQGETSSVEGPPPKTQQNQIVQTDVHILPPGIDKEYTSDVWELRRRALQLASISRCATRSTQTRNSHFRYGISVQAAPPRDKEVQTRRDNYANTKKLLTFLFGLRGRRDDCQHAVSFLDDELEPLVESSPAPGNAREGIDRTMGAL